MTIKLILVDADDTLWHNERHFQAAHAEALSIVQDFPTSKEVLERFMRSNIGTYGFGAKSFTLSMLEAAATLMGPQLDDKAVLRIIALGKELLSHPVEIFDGVAETLDVLQGRAPLVLLTKGDLLHQETKLAASGLGDRFAAVDIVSDKLPATFSKVFGRHHVAPHEAIMIGDSLRSDILPALEAGAYAAYIPHPLAWSFEVRDEPAGNERFRKVGHIREVPAWIDTIP